MATPKITLYTNHSCPWAHRAHIILKELGLPFDEVIIDLETPREEWYLKINPVSLPRFLFYLHLVFLIWRERGGVSSRLFFFDIMPRDRRGDFYRHSAEGVGRCHERKEEEEEEISPKQIKKRKTVLLVF
jgi:glutaredoxin